jgi:hypothetical protein
MTANPLLISFVWYLHSRNPNQRLDETVLPLLEIEPRIGPVDTLRLAVEIGGGKECRGH